MNGELYRAMLTIRRFEERVVDLVNANEIAGVTHEYVGQEAVAVGVCAALRPDDVITSTHRDRGRGNAARGPAAPRHEGRCTDRVRGRAGARRPALARPARRRNPRRRGGVAVIDVHIPKAGMSTVEVDVVAVHVAVGDAVEAETVLIEVESEKATFDVEAGRVGTVRELLVAEGDEAKVGDVVARIEPAAL